jgi:Domain of unknown function (DUF4178)
LKGLKRPNFEPVIPIGSTGDLPEGKMTVIGAMSRSVTIEGTKYLWSEYLLYNPQIGFRWLVHSDEHWNYVQAVPPGEVSEAGKIVSYRGKRYRIFQDAWATVEAVLGEFYWKVESGEKVQAVDYVAPPYALAKEVTVIERSDSTKEGKKKRVSGEINWSVGTYVTPKQIEKAFGVSGLKRPSGVAPNQPYPYKWIYKYWMALMVVALLVSFLTFVTSGSTRQVFTQTVNFQPLPNADGTQVFFSEPFEMAGRRNIRITGQSPVQNTWVYLEGDLINDETGMVQSFPIDISYYQGVEDGESWTEGNQQDSATTSSMPAGKYVLRLEGQWEKWQEPATVSVSVEQNVSSGFNAILLLIGLSILPVIMLIYHINFERRRWSDSMFSGGE